MYNNYNRKHHKGHIHISIHMCLSGGNSGYGARGGADHWAAEDPYSAASARSVMAPYAAAAAYGHHNSAAYGHGSTWNAGADDAWD